MQSTSTTHSRFLFWIRRASGSATSRLVGFALVAAALVVAGSCNRSETSTDKVGQSPIPQAVTVRAPTLLPGDRDEYGVLPASVAGFAVTRGAAAGYVADAACKECHAPIYESYQAVGMARSFYRPDPDNVVEKLDEVYRHADTGYHYVMTLRDGDYVLQRYCLDAKGQKFAEYEAKVAWVIGSGNHVRTYLSQTDYGELHELPLSWYAGDGWAMSPGYERVAHDGFERRIERACMFCHNAYPEVPVGADLSHKASIFPKELPHGIGCQRCHGPGARHIELASQEDSDPAEINRRIVNPGRMAPERQNEVCMTCHLQPESLVGDMMPRSFDLPMYAHRPGKKLTDFIHFLDHGTDAEREERIEVNHHAYRLRGSRCHTESAGKLTCLTCHDPHRKVPKQEQADFYRKKCVQCHELTDCKMEEMGKTRDPATSDCVSCHMVPARPIDVVHTTITDHRIRRRPPERDLTARIPETSFAGTTIDIVPYFEEPGTAHPQWELYAGFGRANVPTPESMARFKRAFTESKPQTVSGYVDVGVTLMQAGAHGDAVEILAEAVRAFPDVAEVHLALGNAFLAAQRPGDALQVLLRGRDLDATDPGIHRSIADAHSTLGQFDKARPAYEQSLASRPVNWLTRRQYAYCLLRLGDLDAAIDSFTKAIALRPDDGYAYQTIAVIHQNRKQWAESLAVLNRGATLVLDVKLSLVVACLLCPDPAYRDVDRALALAGEAVRDHGDKPSTRLHLAFATMLSKDPRPTDELIRVARAAGADPASCTALESLNALGKGENELANKLLAAFKREQQTPTDEPIRDVLIRFIETLGRRPPPPGGGQRANQRANQKEKK